MTVGLAAVAGRRLVTVIVYSIASPGCAVRRDAFLAIDRSAAGTGWARPHAADRRLGCRQARPGDWLVGSATAVFSTLAPIADAATRVVITTTAPAPEATVPRGR